MRILITGGAGFIGHHVVEHVRMNRPDWDIVVLDGLTYAGVLERLHRWCDDPQVRFIYHDFRATLQSSLLQQLGRVDVILHAGAETHVGRSLTSPSDFVSSNVVGTFNMLEAARQLEARFVLVSTDEVYGPAPEGMDFSEGAPHQPSNPYSATKAGAECLALAWEKSFGVPVTIGNSMNNFGERQHPEKFIPLALKAILEERTVQIHVGSDGTMGSRKWLHARNHADALMFLIDGKHTGQYHITGEERTNLEIAQLIAEFAGKPLKYQLHNLHNSQPGHDLRYGLCDNKIRELGWKPPVSFLESLERTVKWTVAHQEWLIS